MSSGGKPGPEPDRVQIDSDWQEAVKKAMKKKRPVEGWPERETKKRGGKKRKT